MPSSFSSSLLWLELAEELVLAHAQASGWWVVWKLHRGDPGSRVWSYQLMHPRRGSWLIGLTEAKPGKRFDLAVRFKHKTGRMRQVLDHLDKHLRLPASRRHDGRDEPQRVPADVAVDLANGQASGGLPPGTGGREGVRPSKQAA